MTGGFWALQFTYYTDKTISQCMMSLNERLHAKNGKLEGWTEKNGHFALTFSCTVMRRFSRTTRLQAKAERENNITIIKGNVSEGIDPRRRMIIYGFLVLAGVLSIMHGAVLPGAIALFAPLALNIPLEGDYNNSQILVAEVQRSLKAKGTPPLAAVKKAVVSPKPTTIARKPAVTRKAPSAKKPT